MDSISWLIDTQVIKPAQLESLVSCLKRLNIDYQCFDYSHKVVPDMKEPFSIYGSTHLINYFLKNPNPNLIMYFDEVNFSTKKWSQVLGSLMLNHKAMYAPLREVFNLNLPEPLFIKPDSDLKLFTGSVVNKEGLRRFYQKVENQEFSFSLDLPVVINQVFNTGWEWRLFMYNHEVLGASSYKLKNMINQSKPTPQSVVDFAVASSKKWKPASVYVMDVCETEDGLKIVEFNCFHASGLYNCNIDSIFTRLTEALKK